MTGTPETGRLEEASEILRTLTAGAVHEGRTAWKIGHTLGSKSPVVTDDPEKPTVLIETWAARLEDVNAYIATMGPRVGTELADWLGCLSVTGPEAVSTCGWCGSNHADLVARALLSEPAPAKSDGAK